MRRRSFPVEAFFVFAAVAASVYLDCRYTYGVPKMIDCLTLLQTLPNDAYPTVFLEEQLVTAGASWPGIINPFPRPVQQLPKYWSLGQ